MKSWVVHYKNKFPGGKVIETDSSLDVWDKDGNHAVAMRRDGHGNLVCKSDEHGCVHAHDLSPIPRASRVYKLSEDGCVTKDDEAADRETFMASKDAELLMDGGRVKSIAEVGKKLFDDKGNLLK